jgi:hypothetical protein
LKSGDGEADLFHVSSMSLSLHALAGLCRISTDVIVITKS